MNTNVFSISPEVVVSEKNFIRLNTFMEEVWGMAKGRDGSRRISAKLAGPINGQDERRINAPPFTVPPVFADGQSRRESPKMASRPFQS